MYCFVGVVSPTFIKITATTSSVYLYCTPGVGKSWSSLLLAFKQLLNCASILQRFE